MSEIGGLGFTVIRPGRGGAAGWAAPLLETGQTTCYHVGDDGDYEIGIDKAYTVLAAGVYAGTSNIEVASYAAATISFTAPNTVADIANGLAHILTGDTVVIKGSVSNDGVYTVTGGGVAGSFTVTAGIVNEVAGRYVSLYKRAAHSNNCVQDNNTGRMWSRNTSVGERVGAVSNGDLKWYDATEVCTLHPAAADLSIVIPGNILRIVGGAAEITRYHVGDLLKCTGFANPNPNDLPGYYVLSVTVNGADLDIVLDPINNVLIAEAAGGARSIGLVCRSCFNYAAGARLAGLSGYTDWRVPYRSEGQSIQGGEAPNAYPNAVAFPVWTRLVHTNTTRADVNAHTLCMDYLTGTCLVQAKNSLGNNPKAALVRG